MPRFTETVDIRRSPSIRFDSSSLTSRLDAFSNQQAQIHSKKVAETSFDRGVASFKKGEKPEFKKERFFGNIGSTSYNKGLRAAYIASIDRDNRENISRIAAENSDDLSKFNDAVETYKKFTLVNIDPTARDIVAESMESLVSTNRIRVQNNEISRTHKESAQAIIGQVELASRDAMGFARDGDDIASAESALAAFASVDAAVDAGFITPESGIKQKRDIERGLVENKSKGEIFKTFNEQGVVAAYSKLNDLAGKRNKGFTPDEWDSFISGTQTDLNRMAARQEKEAAIQARNAKLEVDYSSIQARLNGDDSQIIDPKLADQFYQEKLAPEIQSLPLAQRQAVQAQYIDSLKVVPGSIVSQITNAANSNNPDLLMEAAQLIDRIDEIPGIVNKVPKDKQAYVQVVTDLMQNMSPAEAVDLARKATDPKDKARIDAARQSIKELKKDDPNIYFDRAESAFSKWYSFNDPDLDEVSGHQMAKEYGDIYESFRMAGSTESAAFKKADQFIKRSWGESSVLGRKTIMKYRPEDYYSINGDASWVKTQLMEDISGEIAGHSVGIDNVFLMSNDLTARTASSGRPSYAVKVMIDGVFHNIGDWAPDLDREVEIRKKKSVSDALHEREKRISSPVDIDNLNRVLGDK